MRGSILFFFSASLSSVFAEPFRPGIPEKSWAVIGYESFNAPVKKIPKTAKAAAKVPKKIAKKVESNKEIPPPITKKSPINSESSPNPASKAALGIGAAAVAAAFGGTVLAGKPKPELALIAAIKKPLVREPVVVQNYVSKNEGASIPSEIFNLVKGIVGVGVLSLPAGVATFGSAPSAFIPAGILITIIGIMSGYGFSLIGRVCAYTGAKTYREAWGRTIGEGTSWIPAWSTTCKTFLACLAYSMVLADTFSSLLETARTSTLLTVTMFILTPLCLMKNLKSLAPFSLVGVMGMAYTALAMTVRWLDGSYSMAGEEPGPLVSQLAKHLKPKFGNIGARGVLSPNSLILVCMLSTAYMAHFNAPKFYLELRNNTIKRYNSVVSWSFGISIFLMGFITMVGFLTFGKHCDGLVLNNYAGNDVWMGFSRIAVALSLVFSYPLAFTGCRDGFLDLASVPVESRGSGLLNIVTVSLLGIITFLAASLTDVSFVLAFGGATLGNALTYVYPALMYRAVVKQQGRKGENLGVTLAMGSAVLGVGMGAVGATMALRSLD